jgi:hypothetical protein
MRRPVFNPAHPGAATKAPTSFTSACEPQQEQQKRAKKRAKTFASSLTDDRKRDYVGEGVQTPALAPAADSIDQTDHHPVDPDTLVASLLHSMPGPTHGIWPAFQSIESIPSEAPTTKRPKLTRSPPSRASLAFFLLLS